MSVGLLSRAEPVETLETLETQEKAPRLRLRGSGRRPRSQFHVQVFPRVEEAWEDSQGRATGAGL